MHNFTSRIISKMSFAFIFLFLYIPIFIVIVFACNSSKSRCVFESFTLKWFLELFKDKIILEAFFNSLILALTASVIATVIGTLAALKIAKFKKSKQTLFTSLNYVPIINSDVITGVSLMLFLKFFLNIFNKDFGFTTALIAHITITMPYVVLFIMPKIKQIEPNTLNAALDLGCSPNMLFFKIILPIIAPSIVGAFMMAFAISFDDFTISYFTVGDSFQTLPVLIYSMVRRRITPKINALFTIIFILVILILILINILNINSNKTKEN